MKPGKAIEFFYCGKLVRAQLGQSVLESILAAKLEVDHSCGGNASCGTCRLFVEEGVEKLPPRNELEADLANDRKFTPQERLACQLECTPLLQGFQFTSTPRSTTKKGFE